MMIATSNTDANRSPLRQLALDAANDMHHVTVPLYRAVWLHIDGTSRRDPAQIITRQIDQHDVLGIFFFVSQQRCFVGVVLCLVCASRPRARYGTQ